MYFGTNVIILTTFR